MNAANLPIRVCRQRTVICVDRVGGKIQFAVFVFVYHYKAVIESASIAELNEIADFERFDRRGVSERTVSLVGGEKIVKFFDARPSGSAVVRRAVVPTRFGCEVHNARSRIHALRREVGAVAADVVEAVIVGIAFERPAFCIRFY